MKQHNKWILFSILTTLVLGTVYAEEKGDTKESSSIEVNIKEISMQCQEQHADVISSTDEELSSLIDKCIEEKLEKLKKFAEEQG